MSKPQGKLRSALFVPAANPRAMVKTRSLPMDAVIFDLEDSVSVEEKQTAHQNLESFFNEPPTNTIYRIIRVNALNDTSAHDELAFVARLAPDAILLPKVEQSETIDLAAGILTKYTTPPPALWAMIETPLGILNATSIAAHTCLTTLVVGPNDIALATGVQSGHNRQYLVPWLMQIVLAAKAHNCCVLDGVYNDYKNHDGLQTECAQAAMMGFDGKTLIHPGQIEIANRAFMPDAKAIAKAQAIVAAFSLPENQTKGVISIEGEMVERLHLEQAQMLLARA